jgi:hypothetical protein
MELHNDADEESKVQYPQLSQDDGTVIQETLDGTIIPETLGGTVIPDTLPDLSAGLIH